MKKIISLIPKSVVVSCLLLGLIVSFGLISADVVLAADNVTEAQNGLQAVDNGSISTGKGLEGFIKTIINILLFLIGSIAVIMIIIGGIRYTTSNGDQAQVTSAKNTILYSIVGIVVAFMSYAIVWFVADRIGK